MLKTISLSQKVSTPFNTSRRNQEGIKVFQNKIRYNPITGEYYSDFKNNSNYSNEDNIINDKYLAIQKNTSNNNNSSGIIDQLRNKLISRGPKSIFNFQRMLSIYDYNHSGKISLENFTTIFLAYNLNFSISDIQNIFKHFDKEQTGSINYDLLTNSIIGQMNDRRKNIVQKVFDNFNKNDQSEVSMSEIKQKYNAWRHPDVVNGRKSREEEFGDFLDKLEIFREYNDNLKMSYSTTMNLNEFLKFYTEISMCIKDDNLFDNILSNCWNINDALDNNNMNNDNYNYNRNYDKNIRERTGKQIMKMNNRPY
jgi:Ca2+-binding EF-hand superfamily protein